MGEGFGKGVVFIKRPFVWMFTGLLILFLLYRAAHSEEDDARYYCFSGIWEDRTAACVSGEVSGIRLQAGGKEQEQRTIYLKNCSVRLPDDEAIYHLRRLCVYLEGGQELFPGNILTLSGTLSEFAEAANPGQFDQKEYYKEKGIYYRFTASEVTAREGKVRKGQALLYHFRDRLQQVYLQCLPEREGGIVSAMVLGDKSLLDMDIRNLYQESGIGHLLAISGLHVSILGMALYRMLKRLSLADAAAVPFCILLVCAYGRMTDFSISTSRAVIMMALLLAAKWLGRAYDGKNALAFAAVVIVLQYPFAVFSCSFLLSFGAMAGIYILCPVLENAWLGGRLARRERRRRRRQWERELRAGNRYGWFFIFVRDILGRASGMLLLSASIQLATVPVVLYFYFEVPVYGIFANLLVIPLASVVVLLSFLGGVLGCILLPLGRIPLGGVSCLLKLYERICLFFQALPGHMQILGRPEQWQLLGYYAVLAAVIFLLWRRGEDLEEKCNGRNRRMAGQGGNRLRAAGIVLPALCILFVLPVPDRGFHMTMLDVGQGDSIYIHTPEGEHILLDGGSTSVEGAGTYRILPFLKSQGVRRLDYMMMTHSDEDHISGLAQILEEAAAGRFCVKALVMPDIGCKEDEKGYQELEELARKGGVPVRYLSAGEAFCSGEVSLACLHPYAGFSSDSPNEESVTLSLRYQDFSCLLTGDLEGEGEERVKALLKEPAVRERYHIPERYTVLKVAHHGSKNSSDEEMLNLVSPEISLISCGRKNRYGHPHGELLERLDEVGTAVIRTDQSGAVRLEACGGRVRCRCFVRGQ